MRGRDIRPFAASSGAMLLWPADARGTPWQTLPAAIKAYLTTYQSRLERRADQITGPWWQLFRTLAATAPHRVAWRDLATELQAAVMWDDRAVALKVLHPELSSALGPDRFLREIKVAARLNQVCQIEVREAQEGDLLLPGRALLAPAGRHLVFRQTVAGTVVAQLTMQPLDKLHRPSVDVLFRSAAEIFRDRVLAVVMTGMGDDGKEGAACVKAQGGTVFTEAEKSCVIYGMPRSIIEAGLSDSAIPLDEMAQAILSYL